MKHKLSKTLALILAVIMALTSLSVTVFAAEETTDSSSSTREESYTWDFGESESYGGVTYSFNDTNDPDYSTKAKEGWIYTDNGGYGAIYVDATSGKFTNYNRGDKWCQINSGTILYLPAAAGTKITINTYDSAGTYTINDSTEITGSSYVVTYTVSSDELTTLTYTDDVEYTYLKVECTANDYVSTIVADNSGVSTDTGDGDDSGDDETDSRANSYEWYFGESKNGGVSYELEGSSDWIYEDLGDYGSIYVDATYGKFNNYNRKDQYCQIGANTVLYVPAKTGTTLTFASYYGSEVYSLGSGFVTGDGSYQVKENDLESYGDVTATEYIKITVKTGGYIVSIIADNTTTITEKDETKYSLTGEITCDDSVDVTGATLTFTDMDDSTYVYSYTAEEAGISEGSTIYSVLIPAGDYYTSVSGVTGYITNDRVTVAASEDGTTNEIYLESDDSVVTTYTLYNEIQDSSTSIKFNTGTSSFSAHSSSSTVAGKVGACIQVPVSSGKTVVVTGYYDGQFTVTGSSGNGAEADSGNTLKATYYTVDDDEYVTIKVTATGNISSGSGSAYINTVVISTTPKTVEYKSSISVPGDYDTVTEAISAINAMDRESGESGRVTITLTDDIQEQVHVDADYVTIDGDGHEINWYYGLVCKYYSVDSNGYYSETLFRDKYSKNDTATEFWGGVVIVDGSYFIGKNVTFRNTFNYKVTDKEILDGVERGSNDCSITLGDRTDSNYNAAVYSQKERANALAINGDKAEFYKCSILSSQDTLGYNGSNSYYTYFKDCVIGGNVDYICGGGTMVFDGCTLQWYVQDSPSSNLGYICAPKTSPYIFRNCTVTAADKKDNASSVSTSSYQGYYGRTWGTESYAYFINCETNGYIRSDGWGEMSTGQLKTAYFYEYGNMSNGLAFSTSSPYTGKDSDGNAISISITTSLDADSELLANVIDDTIITAHLDSWLPTYYEIISNVFKYGSAELSSVYTELLVYGVLPSIYAEKIAKVGFYFKSSEDDGTYKNGLTNDSDTVYNSITFNGTEYTSSVGYVYGAVLYNEDGADLTDTSVYAYTYVTTTDGNTYYSTSGEKIDVSSVKAAVSDSGDGTEETASSESEEEGESE